jgi:hypothetical protein
LSDRIKLPADVELEDRVAFGLTARQLAILAVSAIAAYIAFAALSAFLPAPGAAALATPPGIVGVALALGRRDGVSGDQLALFAARHFARPRRRVTAPEGLPASTSKGVGVLELPVRAVLRSGLVDTGRGSFCVLLSATGTSFQLRSPDEQAGLVEAFGRFLNGQSGSVQITVRGEPLDLRKRAHDLECSAGGLAHEALARAACGHARFLSDLAGGEGVRRREILLVLATRAPDRDAAAATLTRRAAEAQELLGGAGVSLHQLDGDQTAGLLARTLDPPGPPVHTHLEGTVHAC